MKENVSGCFFLNTVYNARPHIHLTDIQSTATLQQRIIIWLVTIISAWFLRTFHVDIKKRFGSQQSTETSTVYCASFRQSPMS